jgi:phage tail sheath gpL-like
MVSFNEIPSNLRVPFVTAEIDGSNAAKGPSALAYRGLLIGTKLSTGTATADTLYKVTSADQVVPLAGRGSQLHRMARAWFAQNRNTELWIGVLAENAGGVAATGTLTIGGSPTAAGTIYFYVSGERITVPVAVGDTPTTIATALVAAIGATSGSSNYAVKASNAAGVVTLTAHHKGLEGNEIDLRLNYADGEALPAGVTGVIVKMASGTLNPVLTTLIANLGDSWFHVWAHPFNDATSLTAIEAELSSRFSSSRMIDGVAVTAKNDTYANVGTLGGTRNSKHSVILRTNESPTSPAEYAAAVAGVVANYGAIDPARPFQTLELVGVKAPAEIDRDTLQERNLLLYTGISTTRVGAGGVVQVDRLITTYRLNAAGSSDTAFLDLNTMLILMYARFNFRTRISTRYPRHKLGKDGARYPAGEAVMTPSIGRAEAVNWFLDMATASPVVFDPSGLDQFKTDLVVEVNASDPNRLDFLLPPDLINQLIVTAAKIQFLL